MRLVLTIVGACLLLLALYFTCSEAADFKFTNAVCESFNRSLVQIETCRIKAVNRRKNVLNLKAILMHALNDCTLNAQLFKKASGFKPWLYKLSVEACAFLSRPYNPIALIVFRLFKEFSNLNHTCPYEGALIVKGFYLRSEILPNAMPTGEYMLNVTWNVYKRAQAVTLVYFMYNEDLN